MTYRLATQHDVEAVMIALLDMLDKSPSGQMKYASPVAAELGVRDFIHRESAVVWKDYFIMFDEFSPWFTDKTFLAEVIILRISRDKGGTVTEAVGVLDRLAIDKGCEAGVAGDTQIGYMTPHYRRNGWELLGTQFIKGFNDGVPPQDHRTAGAN